MSSTRLIDMYLRRTTDTNIDTYHTKAYILISRSYKEKRYFSLLELTIEYPISS